MLLHQLRLVYIRDPALQFLRMFGEELELRAVTFRMLPGVVITDLGWRTDERGGETTQLKPGINSALSGHAARAGMSPLISLHKEELTRHPIFNSSAPPSCQVFCDAS